MTQFLNNEHDIKQWLDCMKVKNYSIIPHETYGFVVNVKGDVYLRDRKISLLPVKFCHVEGEFDCKRNNLTSLLGAPNTINGHFICSENQLTSLDFSPQEGVVVF